MSDPQQPTPPPEAAAPASPVPPAPAVPPPGSFGPPPRQGKRTALIVGAVVGVTALLGGGAAIASLGGDGGSDPQQIVGPGGINGGLGPAIDPNAGPVVPEIPSTTVPEGPQPPPPTTAPTTTTTAPPVNPGGQVYDVGAGVTIAAAPGWELLGQDNGIVGFGSQHGELWIALYGGVQSANEVMQLDIGETAKYVQQLQVVWEDAVQVPTASLVDGAGSAWTGFVATAQGGSVPVEGVTLGYLRGDGLGIAISQLNIEGEWSQIEGDVGMMVGSIDYGTPQSVGG